jgi:hypothetical protein
MNLNDALKFNIFIQNVERVDTRCQLKICSVSAHAHGLHSLEKLVLGIFIFLNIDSRYLNNNLNILEIVEI